MKTEDLLIIGAVAVGAYWLLKSTNAGAAPRGAIAPAARIPALQLGAINGIAARLGALWAVPAEAVQTVDWSTQGNAIGNYSGMTQDAANTQAVTDYNNQFLSPFGSPKIWN